MKEKDCPHKGKKISTKPNDMCINLTKICDLKTQTPQNPTDTVRVLMTGATR